MVRLRPGILLYISCEIVNNFFCFEITVFTNLVSLKPYSRHEKSTFTDISKLIFLDTVSK